MVVRAPKRVTSVAFTDENCHYRLCEAIAAGKGRTMRVMVLVKATEDSEREFAPGGASPEAMAAMDRFNDELDAAGIRIVAAGLKPSRVAIRVAFDGTSRTPSAGPFIPAEELVAGFWIWKVKDMGEALAWVKRCPNPMPGPSIVEIRPFYEDSDFA
jgi:hypothetical protein